MDPKRVLITSKESLDSLMKSRFWNWFLIIAAGVSVVVAVRNIYIASEKISEYNQ